MWDLPEPGLEPVSPALAGGFLTTVPPGKSLYEFFYSSLISSVISWLFSSTLFRLHVSVVLTIFFPVIDFQSHSVVVRKDA